MKKILFIDDEPFYCKQYYRCLQQHFVSRFTLHLLDRADEGLEFIKSNGDVVLVILDIMMPSPPQVDEELTDYGKNTGIWLLDVIREIAVKKNLKLFLLSNRGIDDIQREVKRIAFPIELIRIGHKPHIPASDLPIRIQAFLDQPIKGLRPLKPDEKTH